jgi:hypothetical protein
LRPASSAEHTDGVLPLLLLLLLLCSVIPRPATTYRRITFVASIIVVFLLFNHRHLRHLHPPTGTHEPKLFFTRSTTPITTTAHSP